MWWSLSCCSCRLRAISADAFSLPGLHSDTSPLPSPAVHPGCVGEVAPPPQHTDAGRKQEAVWVSLSSGPQVGPVEPSCRPGHTRAAVTVEPEFPD